MKQFCAILLLLCLSFSSWSQVTLKGKVVDKQTGQSLPGAHVLVKESLIVVTTNSKGEYSLKLKKGDYNIDISFLGYHNLVAQVDLQTDKTQDFQLEEMSYMSDEVIVSAIRADDNTPITFENISAKDIAPINLGQDIPYLIALTPSTVVTSDAGAGVGYTAMRIRGSDQTRINVTLNGVPLNDPESFGVYWVNLPDLASSLSTMQIQRGIGTSTNGSGAFGASVNIETKKLSDKSFAKINASGGSFNTYKGTVSFGTGLKKGFALEGRVSKIQSDGYIDRASSKLNSIFLSGGYYGKKNMVKFNYIDGHEITYQAWGGIPKDSLETNRTYNPEGEYFDDNGNRQYYDNQVDDYRQSHYQMFYSHEFPSNLVMNTALHYTRGYGYYESYKMDRKYSKYELPNPIIGGDTITKTDMIQRKILDNHFYGGVFSLNYDDKERLQISYGLSYNIYNGDHYGRVIWAKKGNTGMPDRKWYDNSGDKKDFTTYAKASYLLLDNMNVFADMQYRHIDYDMKGTHDDLRDLTQTHTFDFFNPKMGIFYEIDNNQSTYFSFGVGNREPSRGTYRDADLNQPLPTSEKMYDYELGYDYKSTRVSFGANLYYMDYKDQLVLTGKINNVGDAIMINVPESYRAGIETTFAWAILDNLRWDFTATFSQNKIKDFTEYVDNWDYWSGIGDPQYEKNLGETDISFSPNITAASLLSLEFFSGFTLSHVAKYVGKQYIDNTSNDDRSLNAYLLNDIRIDYIMHPNWAKDFGVFVKLNNVLNEKYESNAWVYRYVSGGEESAMYGYYPQAGFNFLAGISFGF